MDTPFPSQGSVGIGFDRFPFKALVGVELFCRHASFIVLDASPGDWVRCGNHESAVAPTDTGGLGGTCHGSTGGDVAPDHGSDR